MDKRKWSVMMRFNDTPSSIEHRKLEEQIRIMEKEVKRLRKKQDLLSPKTDKEHDIVANKLDKEIPDWRRRLTLYR